MNGFVGEQIVVIVFEDDHYLSGDSLLKLNFEQEFNTNPDAKSKVYNVKLKGSKYHKDKVIIFCDITIILIRVKVIFAQN